MMIKYINNSYKKIYKLHGDTKLRYISPYLAKLKVKESFQPHNIISKGFLVYRSSCSFMLAQAKLKKSI